MGLGVDDEFPGESGATVADVLLRVHRSYLPILKPHLPEIHALAHITGGGIPGNLNRALPPSLDAVVHTGTWDVPNVFEQLGSAGGVPRDEIFRAFNMGVGMMVLCDALDADHVIASAESAGIHAWHAGDVVAWIGRGPAGTVAHAGSLRHRRTASPDGRRQFGER